MPRDQLAERRLVTLPGSLHQRGIIGFSHTT
jgi:hypothetical protein